MLGPLSGLGLSAKPVLARQVLAPWAKPLNCQASFSFSPCVYHVCTYVWVHQRVVLSALFYHTPLSCCIADNRVLAQTDMVSVLTAFACLLETGGKRWKAGRGPLCKKIWVRKSQTTTQPGWRLFLLKQNQQAWAWGLHPEASPPMQAQSHGGPR